MVEPAVNAPVIVGGSGASGKGWSELKDIECTRRYMYIKQIEAARDSSAPRAKTQYDEAYQTGIFVHAARAHWLVSGQLTNKETLEACYAAGRNDCETQGFHLSELSFIEYSLMFCNYASYWGIRPLLKPYAVEYYLEYDWASVDPTRGEGYIRTTRLDDVGFYPDVGGYCIGEFKTTFDLSGALKYYTAYNPQIIMQWLLYHCAKHDGPEIKGTMVDIWDKGKNKGTRHFIPINKKLMYQYECWLMGVLLLRARLMRGEVKPHTNFLVCNTFTDAYKSQCAFKEKCGNDD